MASLKLKKFHAAEADCDAALRLEPAHIKSLQRRATARDALGKHRAALADLQLALHSTQTKELHQQKSAIRDKLRAAATNAPLQALTVT